MRRASGTSASATTNASADGKAMESIGESGSIVTTRSPPGKAAFDQRVHSVDRVGPANLLSLVNPSRAVADRDLDNLPARAEEFRRQLGFEVEAHASQLNTLERLASKHLVGRF